MTTKEKTEEYNVCSCTLHMPAFFCCTKMCTHGMLYTPITNQIRIITQTFVSHHQAEDHAIQTIYTVTAMYLVLNCLLQSYSLHTSLPCCVRRAQKKQHAHQTQDQKCTAPGRRGCQWCQRKSPAAARLQSGCHSAPRNNQDNAPLRNKTSLVLFITEMTETHVQGSAGVFFVVYVCVCMHAHTCVYVCLFGPFFGCTLST